MEILDWKLPQRVTTTSSPKHQTADTEEPMGEYEGETADRINIIWLQQFMDRYDRLPAGLEIRDVLIEISSRLTDQETDVRRVALRTLYEIIPKIEEDVDALVKSTNLIRPLVVNLGDCCSSVRKTSLDVIVAYVKCSSESEFILRTVISEGIESPVSSPGTTQRVIQYVPVILKTIKAYSHSDSISHSTLVHIVSCFSKKMVQIMHQEQVVRSFFEIKQIIGESKFDHFLETYYPQVKRDFDMFCQVYQHLVDISDQHSDSSSSYVTNKSEELDDFNEDTLVRDESDYNDLRKLSLDGERIAPGGEIADESYRSNTTEAEDTDEDENSDDDVIMKIFDEDGNEVRRTSSRRVTFGGEVVKIRTPDSDATTVRNLSSEKLDITANIVIQISNDEDLENVNNHARFSNGYESRRSSKQPKSSHIPLPVRPALNKPKYYRAPFRQPSTTSLGISISPPPYNSNHYEELSNIPNYDGGDSLTTSSSDSSDHKGSNESPNPRPYIIDYGHKEQVLINNTLIDLTKFNITDRIILENLFRKDDWHLFMRGLDRLAVTLRQPEIIQNLSSSTKDSSTGVSLLCYLLNSLSETKTSQRVTTSILRATKALSSILLPNVLNCYLISLVPAVCKYLSPNYTTTVRLEATETFKMLMHKLTPTPVINILFAEQCFFSRSSKMRENSLLCLMYALITFPSTEFNRPLLTEILIKQAIKELKRRVRQALLDTLSILAQFLPRSQFKVDSTDTDAIVFKEALRARLVRRQLPMVSPDGLILYAFQISPATPFGSDIEWILNGHGSLSLNCCKTSGQYTYLMDDLPLSAKSSNWIIQSTSRNMGVNGSAGTIYSEQSKPYFDPSFYDQNKYMSSEETLDGSYEIYKKEEEWNDSKIQYSNLLGFPKLNTQSEFNNVVEKIPTMNFPYYSTASKLPVRHTSVMNKKQPDGQHMDENKEVTLPLLNKYSPSKKIINQINCYIRENQESAQRIRQLENKNYQLIKKSESPQRVYQSPEKSVKSKTPESQKAMENKDIEVIENVNDKYANNPEITEAANENMEESNKKTLLPIEIKETSSENINLNQRLEEQTEKQDQPKIELNESNETQQLKPKKFLERKPGVKLKRSLTKEIKMPQNSFCLNPETIPPFEFPKDAICKTLLQMESNEWETVIQGLQAVVRLTKHHSKLLAPSLHTYILAVSKHVRNLRSQVARAACLSAENIFKSMSRISDQDIEEIANSLFSRTTDTNKFLREDSNKALDVLIDHMKLSKCISGVLQKAASHPNALVRSSASRLLSRLIKIHGPGEIMNLPKENRDMLLNTAVKFIMDANLETRSHAKEVFTSLSKDRRLLVVLSETVPSNVMNVINKSLSRIARSK